MRAYLFEIQFCGLQAQKFISDIPTVINKGNSKIYEDIMIAQLYSEWQECLIIVYF